MKKLLRAIPTGTLSIIAIALDAYLSLASDPIPSGIQLFAGADKVVHYIMYLLITFAFLYDYTKFKYPHHTKLDKQLLFTACAMLLGLLLECLQLVMQDGRSYETLDIIVNCAGAASSFLLYYFLLEKYVRKIFRHHHHHHHRHRK